jgi:23S rRNA pseudouridine2605 synthase
MATERLQKVLAQAGVASRRQGETLIANGRVTVDGKVATLGTQVDPDKAVIAVDGRVIGAASTQAYLLLHKPRGVTSTSRDRHADRTVLELLPTALVPEGAKLYPVGRLDQDSEGMLLLTNDGAWSERVLHPRFGVEREYALGLRQPLDARQVDALRAGIPLDEGLAELTGLRAMSTFETEKLAALMQPPPATSHWYRATLAQGWKRQLRRMFGTVGAPVERLVRVRIGPVRIDGLSSGAVRPLKAPEIRGLAGGGGSSQRRDAKRPDEPAPTAAGPRSRRPPRS